MANRSDKTQVPRNIVDELQARQEKTRKSTGRGGPVAHNTPPTVRQSDPDTDSDTESSGEAMSDTRGSRGRGGQVAHNTPPSERQSVESDTEATGIVTGSLLPCMDITDASIDLEVPPEPVSNDGRIPRRVCCEVSGSDALVARCGCECVVALSNDARTVVNCPGCSMALSVTDDVLEMPSLPYVIVRFGGLRELVDNGWPCYCVPGSHNDSMGFFNRRTRRSITLVYGDSLDSCLYVVSELTGARVVLPEGDFEKFFVIPHRNDGLLVISCHNEPVESGSQFHTNASQKAADEEFMHRMLAELADHCVQVVTNFCALDQNRLYAQQVVQHRLRRQPVQHFVVHVQRNMLLPSFDAYYDNIKRLYPESMEVCGGSRRCDGSRRCIELQAYHSSDHPVVRHFFLSSSAELGRAHNDDTINLLRRAISGESACWGEYVFHKLLVASINTHLPQFLCTTTLYEPHVGVEMLMFKNTDFRVRERDCSLVFQLTWDAQVSNEASDEESDEESETVVTTRNRDPNYVISLLAVEPRGPASTDDEVRQLNFNRARSISERYEFLRNFDSTHSMPGDDCRLNYGISVDRERRVVTVVIDCCSTPAESITFPELDCNEGKVIIQGQPEGSSTPGGLCYDAWQLPLQLPDLRLTSQHAVEEHNGVITVRFS